MHYIKIILLSLCVLLASAGCTVVFDIEQEDIFFCESDDVCIDGYECSANNFCVKIKVGPIESPDCEDKDGDGYGVGADRSKCQYPEEDCDDNNPNVHPNNTETCDGVDNSCDGNIDVFTCPGGAAIECGSAPEGGNDVKFACVDKQCVLVHKLQTTPECQAIAASCNSAEKAFTYESGGQTYNLTDETGALQGPIAEVCG